MFLLIEETPTTMRMMEWSAVWGMTFEDFISYDDDMRGYMLVWISPAFLAGSSGILYINLCVSASFGVFTKLGAASDLQIPWSKRLFIEALGQIV